MGNQAKRIRKIIRQQYQNDAAKMLDVFWQSVERMGFWKRVSFCFSVMLYQRVK